MQATILLSALQPWADNPRTDLGDIAPMVASLHEHGLIEPLVVRMSRHAEDRYDVICGNRRLAGLRKISGTADRLVDCMVLDSQTTDEHCLALAVAENTVRKDMGPIEEAAAFTQLVADGKPIREVAASYGVTVRYVEQRQALVKLLPAIKKLVAKGEVSLSIAAALTLANKDQQQLWLDEGRNRSSDWGMTEAGIKRVLTETSINVATALFDVDTCGIAIVRDLFAEDNTSYFASTVAFWTAQQNHIDTVLIPMLTAEGWRNVVSFAPEVPYRHWSFHRLYDNAKALPAEVRQQIKALETEMKSVTKAMNSISEDEAQAELYEKLEEQHNEIAERISLIIEDQHGIGLTPKQRKKCDAHVIVCRGGHVTVLRGLITAEEWTKALADKRPAIEDENGESAEADDGDENLDDDGYEIPAEPTPAEPVDAGFRLTKDLIGMLNDHRAMTAGLELLETPDLALRFVVANLLVQHRRPSLLTVKHNSASSEAQSESMFPKILDVAMIDARVDCCLDKLPTTPTIVQIMDVLENRENAAVLKLLATLVAEALIPDRGDADKWPLGTLAGNLTAVIGDRPEVRLRRTWTPGAAFFEKISKAGMVEIAVQSGYANPKQLAKMKPADMRAELVKHFRSEALWTPAGAGFAEDIEAQNQASHAGITAQAAE